MEAKSDCGVEECVRSAYLKGYCKAHYAKWYRWGDPLGRKLECEHCGCSYYAKYAGRRYCSTCVPSTGPNATYLLKTYGITQGEFDAMYFDQDGQCALTNCPNEATDVDHCHKTGKVRALLCRRCNVQLGHLEMDEWYKDALEYLHENSAF